MLKERSRSNTERQVIENDRVEPSRTPAITPPNRMVCKALGRATPQIALKNTASSYP
jgi:hypothetical protein